MSCDTHKYGYASKGTSVVLYRDKALRAHQVLATLAHITCYSEHVAYAIANDAIRSWYAVASTGVVLEFSELPTQYAMHLIV
jgi:glutamate/tyrosine decarboxylase-like PLP-dependent enzyme